MNDAEQLVAWQSLYRYGYFEYIPNRTATTQIVLDPTTLVNRPLEVPPLPPEVTAKIKTTFYYPS